MATFSLQSQVITRSGNNAVVYDLSDPAAVIITLPVNSSWTSGMHWHEDHVEYLQVIKGSIQLNLAGQEVLVSAGDEVTEIKVNKGVWHEWSRADIKGGGGEVVVVEKTDPQDGQKAVFFWNLNGVLFKAQHATTPPYLPEWLHGWLLYLWVTISLSAIFRKLDNYPVYLDIPQLFKRSFLLSREVTPIQYLLQIVEHLVSHMFLLVASWFAWSVGIKPVRDEFTPKDVRERWKRGQR